jgi:hypothetical protein
MKSGPITHFPKIASTTVDAHFHSIFVAKSTSKDRASNSVPISLINALVKSDFIVAKKSLFQNHEKS